MAASEQEADPGELEGVGVLVGLGDVPGDAAGVAVGVGVGVLGTPMVTVPLGAAEGSGATGGLGLVAGTSTWPSFLHAAPAARTVRRPNTTARPAAEQWTMFISFMEFMP
jgi:hypothetical protein